MMEPGRVEGGVMVILLLLPAPVELEVCGRGRRGEVERLVEGPPITDAAFKRRTGGSGSRSC